MKDIQQTAIEFNSEISNGAFETTLVNKKQFTRTQKKALELLRIESDQDLILFSGVSANALLRNINAPVYSEKNIRKKNGGFRSLDIPEKSLKLLQEKLNDHLQSVYTYLRPQTTHGFVRYPNRKSCNILKNASVHTSKNYVLNMDLKDFFHSVNALRVKHVFQNSPFKFNEHLSNCLALLTTYKGRLPQGAPSSPVLSNFAALSLDYKICKLCKTYAIDYSRYADDLTFSSQSFMPEAFKNELNNLIEKEGFHVNADKTRLRSKNRKQLVTGVVVNHKANVDRTYVRKLRAMIFDSEINGLPSAAAKHLNLTTKPTTDHISFFVRRLNGMLAFMSQIRGKDDALTLKMKNRFLNVLSIPLNQ
ncbi:MAG: reverse transcriptase family protein [Cryomorphaceae bacterium]|jgi:RNA-directed DNA polymerase|nr:reverse transcriptase family protein [Cryomorphaceae bacterium]